MIQVVSLRKQARARAGRLTQAHSMQTESMLRKVHRADRLGVAQAVSPHGQARHTGRVAARADLLHRQARAGRLAATAGSPHRQAGSLRRQARAGHARQTGRLAALAGSQHRQSCAGRRAAMAGSTRTHKKSCHTDRQSRCVGRLAAQAG